MTWGLSETLANWGLTVQKRWGACAWWSSSAGAGHGRAALEGPVTAPAALDRRAGVNDAPRPAWIPPPSARHDGGCADATHASAPLRPTGFHHSVEAVGRPVLTQGRKTRSVARAHVSRRDCARYARSRSRCAVFKRN